MISNVTKSADILRGATEWQDLWAEVEKELPVKGLPPPRVLQNEIMIGKVRNEQERREELERLAHTRQQRTNFYQSDSAKALKARKSSMTPVERKTIQSRLTRRTASCPAKPKSVTNLGFVTGEHHSTPGTRLKGSPEGKPIGSPQKKEKGGVVPKSKAVISPPGTLVKSERRVGKKRFEGLGEDEWYRKEWTPSFEYRPAAQSSAWKEVEGFSKSTRTLERRKLNPFLDINSFTGNYASAKAQFNSHAWVRPLDNKGNLGARPVQMWKETLREDFARDDDNFSSNAHDANLDSLRVAMGGTDFFSDIE